MEIFIFCVVVYLRFLTLPSHYIPSISLRWFFICFVRIIVQIFSNFFFFFDVALSLSPSFDFTLGLAQLFQLGEEIEMFYGNFLKNLESFSQHHKSELVQLFLLKSSVLRFEKKAGKAITEKRIEKLWKRFVRKKEKKDVAKPDSWT